MRALDAMRATTPCDRVLEPVTGAHEAGSLHPLLAHRRSLRALGGDRVPDAVLTRLIEAARWAPSSRNEQPWRFVVVRREDSSAHAAAADVLTHRNRLWAPQAPLLMLGLARLTLGDGKPNLHAHNDLGQAVAHLTVQAMAEGLAVHQMGGFDRVGAREVFGVPENCEPMVMLAVGYPGEAADLPEELRAQETAPRARRPLGEIAFEGRFGVPLKPAT